MFCSILKYFVTLKNMSLTIQKYIQCVFKKVYHLFYGNVPNIFFENCSTCIKKYFTSMRTNIYWKVDIYFENKRKIKNQRKLVKTADEKREMEEK